MFENTILLILERENTSFHQFANINQCHQVKSYIDAKKGSNTYYESKCIVLKGSLKEGTKVILKKTNEILEKE